MTTTPTLREAAQQVLEALEAMLRRDERNTCQHETTHRGGAIWTICDDCGMKWADDRGGKPRWKDPQEWVVAGAAVTALRAALAEPVRQPKLIGWRTENFLHETSDREVAKNWEPHIGVLPIFEGDPNTSLLPNNSIGSGNG